MWFSTGHYENMSMQYIAIFTAEKIKKLDNFFWDNFLIFAQNIGCGYTLEPPQ